MRINPKTGESKQPEYVLDHDTQFVFAIITQGEKTGRDIKGFTSSLDKWEAVAERLWLLSAWVDGVNLPEFRMQRINDL